MIYERLRVFVSSRMQELAPERGVIRSALGELHIDGWVFEEDAGARPQAIQQTYKQEIDAADLYIGLFWRGYGDYTIDEFNYATEKNKDRLIYEKRDGIEGERDPRLQVFLDRIGKVESGLTVRWFNTPEELGEGIKQDAARWQAEKVRELRAHNVGLRAGPVEPGDRRELKILLEKVKRFWIEGVLERSMQRERLLELDKDEQREAVENPWEAVLELPFEGSRAVPAGKGIADVFEDVQHSLLVLGRPGSGKTTTLLTLARELIDRADADPAEPIPVVFNLSSWTGPEQPLAAWLESELSAKYQIPGRIGKTWLEHNRLLLLLDGLDEVEKAKRTSCVEAINRFVREIGLPGLAVCCRSEQYEELNVKLALNGAISLRPLTDAQIAAYVGQAGTELVGLGTALREDGALRELARSPLMLNLMCLAYRGHGAQDLGGRAQGDRTAHLFATYIDRMFARRGKAELAYPRERTLTCLSWIARRLSERNQAMFLMEELQPDWLASSAQRWAYLAGLSLVLGLLIGCANIAYWSTSVLAPANGGLGYGEIIVWLTAMPAWFLAIGWAEGRGSDSGTPVLERAPPGMPRAALKVLVMSVALALIAALAAILFSPGDRMLLNLIWAGVPIVLLLAAKGAARSISFSIKTAESLGWSPSVAWKGALLGLIGGLAVGAFVFLPDFGIDQSKKWVLLLGFGSVGAALGGLLGGLEPRVFKGKTVTNQGIRSSLRMAVLVGLNALWLVAMVWAFAEFGGFKGGAGLRAVLGYFAGMFTALFLWYGGIEVLKHYILRAVVAASGQVPWKLGRVLDHARDLNLMQKVGNGYIFVHRRLLEHLAAPKERV
jgi:hypothetical protein